MSEPFVPLSCDIYTTDANPATHTPIGAPDLFVTAPSPDKYARRGGNRIELLNCGDDYWNACRPAIEQATDSIWLAIMAFRETLPTGVDPNAKMIKDLLEEKARSGVEVKILANWNFVQQNFSAEPTLDKPHLWSIDAAYGRIPNLHFLVRDATGDTATAVPFDGMKADDRGQDLAALQRIKDIDREIHDTRQYLDVPTQVLNQRQLTPEAQQEHKKFLNGRISRLEYEKELINSVGLKATQIIMKRIEDDTDFNTSHGSITTNHQKMILIDHRKGRAAKGFVQGFNYIHYYFDHPEHKFRGSKWVGDSHFQDVGAMIQGPVLVDLFHNFQESWNLAIQQDQPLLREAHDFKSIFLKDYSLLPKPVTESTPNIPQAAGLKLYNAQILRTWPFGEKPEDKISEFIMRNIDGINHFVYVEDQYFRMPEFIKALKARANAIKSKCNGQKQLHFFAIVALNEGAYGEAKQRQHVGTQLGRPDIDGDDKNYDSYQTDVAKQAKLQKLMGDNNLKVHICQLCASQSLEVYQEKFRHSRVGQQPIYTKDWKKEVNGQVTAFSGEANQTTRYQNVYVHAKLSIYDDAYLLLGSANWNVRSMKYDSELDIAVQATDDLAKDFRTKLWSYHLGGTYFKPDIHKTPESWYDAWDQALKENWKAFQNKKPLVCNLFPYFEDLNTIAEEGRVNGTTPVAGKAQQNSS